jgi:hypothetical protein
MKFIKREDAQLESYDFTETIAHTFVSKWNDPFLGRYTKNHPLVTSFRCSGVVPQVSVGRGMIHGTGGLIGFVC